MEKHIVIIEDNTDLLETMQILLNAEGYRVTALSALTNVEELIALEADCYILDEQLPYISGHIICIILKSKSKTKDKPVILVSAHEEINHYATLCQADGYLRKPFQDINELTGIVDGLLSVI